MNTLAVIPIIFPLITGIVLTLWRCSSAYRHAYMILSCVVHVLFSTWLVVRTAVEPVIVMAIGGWKAPFGIVLTIDHFAALLIATAGIITLAVSVYTAGESKPPHPLRLPLMHFMLAGVCLSFSTGDFFNLFVAFEIMLMASYALLVLEYRPSDLKYAYSYLLLNIIGSGLFLAAGGLVYRLFGTLNFADISERLLFTMGTDNRVVIISVLMVFVYGLKAGMFPLFYWLPKSYAALPPAIGGLFAGLLTKVGIYALIRILNLLFNNDPLPLLILFVASLFTMIVGILLALTHRSIRMILSFNLIAHIGFMVLGISIFTGTSIMGTVYYMIHH
ncbi:MAG: proton-conducting transporter membrane subunit, partial [Candidatus Marinamargulisbacteria bacterium]|nr:proton-conducting transporter membrane subunit [Candidatus Marinamargulisbacteria bacterium]